MGNYHRKSDEELMLVLDTAQMNSTAHHTIIHEFKRRAAVASIETSKSVQRTAQYTGWIAFFTFLVVLATLFVAFVQKS